MKKFLSVVLVFSMLLSLCMPFVASATEVTETAADNACISTNFPISEETGANAKYFLEYSTDTDSDYVKSATLTNYYPGLDYESYFGYDSEAAAVKSATGVFAVDFANLNSTTNGSGSPYAFVYSTDNTEAATYTTADFVTKNGNTVWTINGADYIINPEEKIFTLSSSLVYTNITDTTIQAIYKSARKASFDVPDGYYDKIGFLATAGYDRTLAAYVYYEGESNAETHTCSIKDDVNTIDKATGNVYLRALYDKSNSKGRRWFQPVEIDVDETKKVTRIELYTYTYRNQFPIHVISAWGKAKSPKTILTPYAETVEVTSENYEEIKDVIAEVDAVLEATGYTAADLGTTKATYDALSDAVEAYESAIEEIKAKEKLTENEMVYLPMTGAKTTAFVESGTTPPTGYDDPASDLYKTGGYDYVYDWKQSLWWNSDTAMGVDSTDSTLYQWTHSPVYYKTSSSASSTYIPLDENSCWTIPSYADSSRSVTFKIEPTSDIIQLTGSLITSAQKFTEAAEEKYAAKFAEMKSAEVEVENDYFKKLHILATNNNGQLIDTGRMGVKIYYEGAEEPVIAPLYMPTTSDTLTYYNEAAGITYDKTWKHNSDVGYAGAPWLALEVECDMFRKIDKIELYMEASNRVVAIASVMGEKASITEMIEAVETDVDVTNYRKQIEKHDIIEEFIDNKGADLSYNSAINEKFSQLSANIDSFLVIKPTLEPTGLLGIKYFKGEKPTVDLTVYNPSEVAGKPFNILFSYFDKDNVSAGNQILGKETLVAEEYNETLEISENIENATKVKGLIWKDLATIKPLSEPVEEERSSTFKVLSIGNSFSNNAHTYLGEIAQDAGFEKIIIANVFAGGCTLDTHYNRAMKNTAEYTYYYKTLEDGEIVTTTTANTTMLDGILDEDWDIITIQQASAGSGKPETFTHLTDIIDYINEHKTNKDAKIGWHMTWAYEDESTYLTNNYNGISQLEMYERIVSTIKSQVLTNAGIDFVIPAGTAIQNLRATSMGDNFNSDGTHLNTAGCYVAGLTWFTTITGISIDDITYTPNNTVKSNLDLIKTGVKNAIATPYAVTNN